MTKNEIFEFIRKNPVFALATVDGKVPRVRNMMVYRADENGIIFCTGRDKSVNKQLTANPGVELCFYNSGDGLQVRIEGTVKALNDIELKKQLVEDFSFLKPWVEKDGFEVLIVYCLKKGRATPWTMETNFKQKEYIQL